MIRWEREAHSHQERTKQMTQIPQDDEQLRKAVRERYGQAALQVLNGNQTEAISCCDPTCCSTETSSSGCCTTASSDAITSNLYSSEELGTLPVAAALASLGCGNPTALAELKPGERVLDLGSGGGIDVLLSAKRVGPTGFAYGLDMTDAMLQLAERNRAEAGVDNVRFLKGVIEAIPLPDEAVDVVISNCVINLSADKRQVFAKLTVSSCLAGALPSRISSFRADCQSRSSATLRHGRAASPGRLKSRFTGNCWPKLVL